MSVWTGPKWARPGSRFSRGMWWVSVLVALFLIVFGWAVVGTGGTPGGVAFLVAWTVGLIAITAWNFYTGYLGRGRRAEAAQRADDDPDSR
jgi:hypothetical protein